MEEKITLPFIFGIGSQRAGSTFVSHLLNAIPNAYVHPLKELHYFDTKYGVRSPQVLELFCKGRLARNIDSMTTYHGQALHELLTDQVVSDFKFINDPSCKNHPYAYHFRAALSRRNDVSYLCESTPEYMLLPDQALAEIKTTIPNCKAVLAVRNPVARFISAFRFLAAHESFANEGSEALSQRAISMLEQNNAWVKQQDQFNRYGHAVSRFEKAGIPVFVILIDKLQNHLSETLSNLESFLEVKLDNTVIDNLAGKKINEVDFEFTPSRELLDKLAERYQKQEYDIPLQISPRSELLKHLPEMWRAALAA
ncbi:MAG: sulfotransferase [Chitinophagaceae bacterium]|nr:MAG: sulfotransferase [Chitinophagaceae bacterium]